MCTALGWPVKVRERSARCRKTMQNDDNCCEASAQVSGAFGALTRRFASA